MEHRRRLEHDGAADEEAERGDVEHVAARPELPSQSQQQQSRSERQGRVQQLCQPARVAEPEPVADLHRPGRERVEAGRRVVLADPVREPLARTDALGVGDVIDRVVAEAGRVVQGVPAGDDGERRDQRERERATPSRHRHLSSPRSAPCTCLRRARAACAAGSAGRCAASDGRRTRRRARSARPRRATRGRGSAPSR